MASIFVCTACESEIDRGAAQCRTCGAWYTRRAPLEEPRAGIVFRSLCTLVGAAGAACLVYLAIVPSIVFPV